MPVSPIEDRLTTALVAFETSKKKYAGFEGQQKALDALLGDYEAALEECKSLDLSYQKLGKFFTSMGTEEQERLQKWFEQVVTYGLATVFGDGVYSFRISGPEVKANEIAIGFDVIERIGDVDYPRDPFEEMGGGVCDVLSFLLQFLMVFLLRDRINPILLIDESFKHLSVQYRPAMANLLQELTQKTPVQILLVTHEPLFTEVADVVYNFSKPDAETIVERIK